MARRQCSIEPPARAVGTTAQSRLQCLLLRDPQVQGALMHPGGSTRGRDRLSRAHAVCTGL
jgi:hypothetical protein